MDIVHFIASVHDQSYIKKYTVVQLSGGGDYPLLFFSTVLNTIKTSGALSVCIIDWTTQADADIASALQSSFLGMRMLYWLGDLDTLDAARKKKWQAFLKKYTGPHLILFYTTVALLEKEQSTATFQTIVLPETIEKSLCLQLFNVYYPDTSARTKALLQAVYTRVNVLSLDQVYLLMRYALLMGKNQAEMVDQWLGLLIGSEKSLFTLSQYFFAKDAQKFFSLWATIMNDYPATFWVVFWSEQLFRACSYVQLMENRDGAQAKRVSFRLPFSFIQRDWRKYTASELRDAHAAIYSVDYQIKNGASDYALDLFYSQFFK